MSRAHSLPIAAVLLLAGTSLATAASAQTTGLRQLNWAGRGSAPAALPTAAGAREDLRRPNIVIPHGGFAAAQPAARAAEPAPAPRRTLTPASAWLRSAPPPQPVAEPPAPEPAPPAPVSAPQPVRPMMAPRPAPVAPAYVPEQGGRGQPSPAEAVLPPPPPPAAPRAADPGPATVDPTDPMAPRRDAPIFRIQQAAPPVAQLQPVAESAARPEASRGEAQPRRLAQVANTGERPPQQGARYYSVHRQNGRTPDELVMPEPTYVDALAITMNQTPASQDLAQPDQGPTLIRDNQGRVRQAPAPSDGDHQ